MPAIIITQGALAAFAGIADEYTPRFDHLPNQRIPLMEDGFNLVLQEAGYDFGRWQENFGKDRRKSCVRRGYSTGSARPSVAIKAHRQLFQSWPPEWRMSIARKVRRSQISCNRIEPLPGSLGLWR